MNKKMRELKAQMEELHNEANVLVKNGDVEGAENKISEIENLQKEYDVVAKLYAMEKEEVAEEPATVENKKSVNKFANMVRELMVSNKASEGVLADGGYTVPEDISTKVEEYRKAEFSLEDMVDVEKTTTNKGSRTFKKKAAQTGFAEVAEGGKIGVNAEPKFERLTYTIKKYAGYLPVTNELLADSDANIEQVMVEWLGNESRATRNKNIIAKIKTNSEVKFKDLDDIKNALNVTLGQAYKTTSSIITNDSGLQYLDTLKDVDGKYLLQPNPTNPMQLRLCAGATVIPVVVVPDAVLANGSGLSEEKKVPFIVGDLKEGIKLFDRQQLSIMTSSVASVGALNAFEEDLTIFRGIEREDVVVKDKDAFVNGYIEIPASV